MLTHRAAVLGSPIAHSLSPLLHRTAYAALGLTDWAYDAYEVGADGLAGFVGDLGPEWAGLSLTMPLKEAALVLADECSPIALQTGAVNTLIHEQGRWIGDNTDVAGLRTALAEAGPRQVPQAVIIGSGATARSALAALHALGLQEVWLAVRSTARESTLAQARDHGIQVQVCPLAEAATVAQRVPVVISTVPAGSPGWWDRLGELPEQAVWLDVVYAGWPTPFARAGWQRGATVISGIDMLVYQAVEQVRLMTGQTVPAQPLLQVGRAALTHAGS